MNRVHNFSAGPATLPLEVLQVVQRDLVDYKGKGLSVMEMSHRSPEYQEIIDSANATLKRIMGLDDDFEVLFLQGGASTQFLMVPLNFSQEHNGETNYIDTGSWSRAAIKESNLLGRKTVVVASSKDEDYTCIPKNISTTDNAKYLHFTSNNTIAGTQFKSIPDVKIPLISDMSSDFLSRPLDFNKFSLIYSGAQKNIGPAGCCVVTIRKSFVETANKNLSTMVSYKTHIDKGSMFNTPPTFSIYVIGLVLKWIENLGGLKEIEKINIDKAKVLYDMLDSSDFYKGTVEIEDRSLMNIPFRLPTEELEAKFISESKGKNMFNLKGHRSVGGCRASIYNAMPKSSVQYLVDFMKKFELENK